MSFENLKAIIEYAIEKEIEAEQFYTEAAASETMSGAKEMLQEFAGEEKKHVKMLENMDSTGFEDYKFEWITDIKRSDYVSELTFSKGMGYQEILMMAMKREEKALQLYNYLQDNAEEEEHKRLFKILCQEEAKHKLALETMYDDYMAEMGD